MPAAAHTPPEGRAVVVAAATTGLAVAAAAVAVPALRFLRAPEVVTVLTGLVVMACGWWSIRVRVPGAAPGLVFASGVAWFVPDLAASGLGWLDGTLARLSLLHVGLLTHALMVRTVRRGSVRAFVVALGYGCAASAFFGGYQVLMVATGAALVAVALATPRGPVAGLATSAASGCLGAGLVVPQVALLITGSAATGWGGGLHATAFTASAGLLTFAMTAVATESDPIAELDRTLSAELGTPLTLVLCDGADGWLDPFGRAVRPPPIGGTWIHDDGGLVVGRLLGAPVRPDGRVVRTVELAATNARLRHDVLRQVDDLAGSRARIVEAAENERHAVLGELRRGILEPLAELERTLRAVAGLTTVAEQAAETRSRLERFAETVDPFRPGESLSGALHRLAGPESGRVVVRECVEPADPSVRRASWFCCAEALANARKHAPGAAIDLAVRSARGGVVVRIADDGPGGADASGGGLAGLRDRVRSLGGTLRVESGGDGTVVEAWLPDLVLVVDHDVATGPGSYGERSRHPGGPS